jgi:hypothetical protein
MNLDPHDFQVFAGELYFIVRLLITRRDSNAYDKKTSDAEKAKVDEALKALRIAATATDLYYEGQNAGKAVDRDKERELALLWDECGRKVKDYDPDLADRFKLKRDYWSSLEKWTAERVKASKIGLHDIVMETEILLDPPKVTKPPKH